MNKSWHLNNKRLCSSFKKEKTMSDWFKKHVDTVVILSGILSSFFWMNGKFSDVQKDIFRLEKEISIIDKEISVIKAVMIVKHIMPPDLASAELNHE